MAAPSENERPSPGDIYRTAVEEYRFQAQFNWTRVQYLLAFNAALLAAGIALIPNSGAAATAVFLIGILAAVLTALVHRVQHAYYRNARDRMRNVEDLLGIPEAARTNTTSTLAGQSRKISVTHAGPGGRPAAASDVEPSLGRRPGPRVGPSAE